MSDENNNEEFLNGARANVPAAPPLPKYRREFFARPALAAEDALDIQEANRVVTEAKGETVPFVNDDPDPGRKYDSDKPDWSLMPLAALESVVKVLTYGAKKYSPGNWAKVPNGRNRYFAAMMRHLAAHQSGEQNDAETGISHLAHAACCLLYLIRFEHDKLNP